VVLVRPAALRRRVAEVVAEAAAASRVPAPFPVRAPAAWKALAGPLAQPEAGARRQAGEAGWGAPAEAAGWGVPAVAAHAVARRQAAAQGVAAQGVAAAAERAAEVTVEGQGAPVALPSVVPWEDASASRRDRVPPWPAPRRSARAVYAMERRPIAWP